MDRRYTIIDEEGWWGALLIVLMILLAIGIVSLPFYINISDLAYGGSSAGVMESPMYWADVSNSSILHRTNESAPEQMTVVCSNRPITLVGVDDNPRLVDLDARIDKSNPDYWSLSRIAIKSDGEWVCDKEIKQDTRIIEFDLSVGNYTVVLYDSVGIEMERFQLRIVEGSVVYFEENESVAVRR